MLYFNTVNVLQKVQDVRESHIGHCQEHDAESNSSMGLHSVHIRVRMDKPSDNADSNQIDCDKSAGIRQNIHERDNLEKK
jgi:hypothetical protein